MASKGNSLLDTVTDAVQAQERLYLELRGTNQHDNYGKVHKDVCDILDKMRYVKSEIDGSAVNFQSVTVNEVVLKELKSYMLMHVPGSLNDEDKNKLNTLVTNVFSGSCKKVLFACLVTCPWYHATQPERGQQAKHNNIFVVYCNRDEQYLSPVSPQFREKESEVVDQGWFYATEVAHFAAYLLKGKARFLEVLHMPESAIFCSSDKWQSLKYHLEPTNTLMMKGFLEQCRGQAVGSVGKKSKHTGKMRVRDSATLYEFCESFRLLSHATMSLSGQPLNLDVINHDKLPPGIQQDALKYLIQSYKAEQCDKSLLLDMIMRWRAEVDKLMKSCKYTPVHDVEKSVGQWLLETRAGSRDMREPASMKECDQVLVQSLLDATIGGPTSAMVPENIIVVARAGSYLYGLDTPESDVDYIIVYADPIRKILSSCRRPIESKENRGPEKSVEYGIYEARLFCEMLLKCSVVMLELIFADDLEFTSPLWQDLVSSRNTFITERAIQQYLGLIWNNMRFIENKQYAGTKRESKLFYQILHKLYCLEFFLHGESPKIKCDGKVREHILHIRRGPLEGDICRDSLYEECQSKIQSMRLQLSQRKTRLPEHVNYNYLSAWLMKVRGW